jgi:hypothetical protein
MKKLKEISGHGVRSTMVSVFACLMKFSLLLVIMSTSLKVY